MEHGGGGGGHEIGVHKLVEFMGYSFNGDTILMTWVSMAFVAIFVIFCTRRLSVIPQGGQNFLEMVIEPVLSQIEASAGKKGVRIVPVVVTLFLFILFANWLGLLPGMTSPTNDLNTTLSMGVMIILLTHVFGVHDKGLKYFVHFVKPNPIFGLIHIMEDCSRPLTMGFRLFGNIMAHEILIIVFLMLAPYVVPSGIMFLGIFIGMIQAAIFTILAITYLSAAFAEEEH